jgi:hypothetical protein
MKSVAMKTAFRRLETTRSQIGRGESVRAKVAV